MLIPTDVLMLKIHGPEFVVSAPADCVIALIGECYALLGQSTADDMVNCPANLAGHVHFGNS